MRAARPTDEPSERARGSFHVHPPPGVHRDRHPHRPTEERPADGQARGLAGRVRGPRPAHRRRQQAFRRGSCEEVGRGHHGRVDAPRARRHPRGPRRQRVGQVDAHPPHLGSPDPRRGSGGGLRLRHRARRDGGQAPDQPGQRRRRLLQEAQPDGEPGLRGPALRHRRCRGQARRPGDPGTAGHRQQAGRPADRADEPGHAAEGRDRASPADEPDAPAPRRADDRTWTRAPSWTSRRSSRSSGRPTTPRSS